MRFIRKLFGQFYADTRGVTAIEFAFSAPVILLFLMGTIEFAYLFMANNMLENAATHAARTGKTGYTETGLTREEYMLQQISNRINGLMDPTKLTMESKSYDTFDDIGKAEPYLDANHNSQYDTGETFTDSNGNGGWDADMGLEGLGNSGEVVVYDFHYDWQMMTPFLQNLLANNGHFLISTRIVLKNEPYSDGG